MKKLLWIGLFAALVMPRAGWAVDACDQDRPKVCGGVTPGEGRVHACMMEKLDQLSAACQKTVKKADRLNHSMETLCADDIQTFCAQYVQLNRPRLVECLKDRYSDLKPTCSKGFDDYRALSYPVRQ